MTIDQLNENLLDDTSDMTYFLMDNVTINKSKGSPIIINSKMAKIDILNSHIYHLYGDILQCDVAEVISRILLNIKRLEN